jgi:hypothetical protein
MNKFSVNKSLKLMLMCSLTDSTNDFVLYKYDYSCLDFFLQCIAESGR